MGAITSFIPDSIAVRIGKKTLGIVDGEYASFWMVSVVNNDSLTRSKRDLSAWNECENEVIDGLTVLMKNKKHVLVKDQNSVAYNIPFAEFFHSARTYGIEPRGLMLGKFIWAVHGGDTFLVSIGSPMHKMIKRETDIRTRFATERGKLPKLRTKDLKPNHVYMTSGGTFYRYIGREHFEGSLGFTRVKLTLAHSLLAKHNNLSQAVFLDEDPEDIIKNLAPARSGPHVSASHGFIVCIGKYQE